MCDCSLPIGSFIELKLFDILLSVSWGLHYGSLTNKRKAFQLQTDVYL